MRYRHSRSRGKRRLRLLLISGAVLYVLGGWLLSPRAAMLAQTDVRRLAEEAVYAAAAEVLAESEGAPVRISYTNEGTVAAVQSDARALTALQTEVSERIRRKLSGRRTVGIRAGSLTKLPALSGRGPFLFLRLEPRGSADVRFSSTFSSAGVNQTLHSLRLDVTVRLTVHALWYTAPAEIHTSFVAGETVIVGEAPGTVYGVRPEA